MSTISMRIGDKHVGATGGATFERRNPLDGHWACCAGHNAGALDSQMQRPCLPALRSLDARINAMLAS